MKRFIALAGLAGLAAVAARVHAEGAASVLEFQTKLRGSGGVVRCGLFTEQGWLKKPVQAAVGTIADGQAVCAFKDVPKGVYGISAFHDENNNGKLDTNFIGLPTEDYGASRDARGNFGPPSFSDAKFRYYPGGTRRITATLK